MIYDVIGDIHGHYDCLIDVLKQMDYKPNDVKAIKGHQLIFLGDYIDRGPKTKETVELVKEYVEKTGAIALMGNHEFNAICYTLKNDFDKGYLRKHTSENFLQMKETLESFYHKKIDTNNLEIFLPKETLIWFKTLPLYYETDEFVFTHACFQRNFINTMQKNKLIDNQHCLLPNGYRLYGDKNSQEYNYIEFVLKGPEGQLPRGQYYLDQYGIKRFNYRVKWWTKQTKYLKDICLLPRDTNVDISVSELNFLDPNIFYFNYENKKIIFGHYWQNRNTIGKNYACLDWSVGSGRSLGAMRLLPKVDDLRKMPAFHSVVKSDGYF